MATKQGDSEHSSTENPKDEPAWTLPMNLTFLNLLHDSGIFYDGSEGAEDFLNHLQHLQATYDPSGNNILRGLSQLLRGPALAWYFNHRHKWTSWTAFLDAFRLEYLLHHELEELEKRFLQRRQRPGESGRKYLNDIETIIRLHGGFSEEERLEMSYRNLSPEYRRYIRRSSIRTRDDLLREITEYEALEEELRTTQQPWIESRYIPEQNRALQQFQDEEPPQFDQLPPSPMDTSLPASTSTSAPAKPFKRRRLNKPSALTGKAGAQQSAPRPCSAARRPSSRVTARQRGMMTTEPTISHQTTQTEKPSSVDQATQTEKPSSVDQATQTEKPERPPQPPRQAPLPVTSRSEHSVEFFIDLSRLTRRRPLQYSLPDGQQISIKRVGKHKLRIRTRPGPAASGPPLVLPAAAHDSQSEPTTAQPPLPDTATP
nr:PREDICTED: uncharacterized protein LOC105662837 [Megachile rotundata]